ncbi:hypothetical protein K439DRAFT_1355757 [Ramaria rubella]|nr:hypothetical protein K439DRAFT_1355757 [Ramaria rubella]
MHIEFLPAYSPDYNPIELAFSAIKAHIRCQGSIAHAVWNSQDFDVYACLFKAVYSVTPDNTHAFYCKCRYV